MVSKKEIRDSIRFRYNDANISYSELLRFVRETEVEGRGTGSGSKGKTDSRTNAKASLAKVLDSAQTSQGRTSSDSDLDNLKNLASSLLKEIQDAMDDMKGQGQGVAKVQEEEAIIEVVEVEEIAMAGEALATSMEEVVSELGQGWRYLQ